VKTKCYDIVFSGYRETLNRRTDTGRKRDRKGGERNKRWESERRENIERNTERKRGTESE